jgi:hypothetical protein
MHGITSVINPIILTRTTPVFNDLASRLGVVGEDLALSARAAFS